MFGKGSTRGVDISPGGIRWVEIKGGSSSPRITGAALEEIPADLVKPSFSNRNIADGEALRAHLLKALRATRRKGDVALSIPNQVVRIFLLHFDELPAERSEVERLVLWKLRKALPIPAEAAKADFRISGGGAGNGAEVIAAVAATEVLREYEDLLRGTGLRPVLVDISSLNTLHLFPVESRGSAAFIDIAGRTVGVALIRDGDLAFFRSKEIKEDTELVEKEILSTVAYYTARNPDIEIDTIYVHQRDTIPGDMIERLGNSFGSVIPLTLPKGLRKGLPAEGGETFSAAIGAALRLRK